MTKTTILFPLYRMRAKTLDPRVEGKDYSEHMLKDAPDGYVTNHVWFHDKLLKPGEEMDLDAKRAELTKVMLEAVPGRIVSEITIERKPDDSWAGTWFGHYTWRMGRSDAEIMADFNEFVERKMRENFEQREWRTYPDGSGKYLYEPYCLMGAEDRWRWRGKEDDSRPPCHCEDCETSGKVHIFH